MYLTKKLSDFIKDFNETDEDFVACHYLNEEAENALLLARCVTCQDGLRDQNLHEGPTVFRILPLHIQAPSH